MPSAARSRLLPEPWVFFLDRSLGSRLVAEALRAEGETVEVHDAHFAKDAADVEWLGVVGRRIRQTLRVTSAMAAGLTDHV